VRTSGGALAFRWTKIMEAEEQEWGRAGWGVSFGE
jgi:hypothetical protein